MGILTQGVLRWGILSVFPKPMPVRYNAAVFPRFFTTNSSMNLPYLPLDSLAASLGENRTFETDGSLCFTTRNHSNCLSLKQHMYGWFSRDRKSGEFSQSFRENKTYTNAVVSLKVLWINGTFMKPPISRLTIATYSSLTVPVNPNMLPIVWEIMRENNGPGLIASHMLQPGQIRDTNFPCPQIWRKFPAVFIEGWQKEESSNKM